MGFQADRSGRFFLVGPLRTGSTLLARCIDDHPDAICLCESEINRALFGEYLVAHHCRRMNAHGVCTEDALNLLDLRQQDNVLDFAGWYNAAHPCLTFLHAKPEYALLGDKSPDFYRSSALVQYLAQNYKLIYTTRDPRGIFASIEASRGSTPAEKAERWASLITNYQVWRPYLDGRNVLIIRYEDLVRMPQVTMKRVYDHLGLPNSERFLTAFPRLHPYRFVWETAIDWETGIRKDFDPNRIHAWSERLTADQLRSIKSQEAIVQFMSQFGYD